MDSEPPSVDLLKKRSSSTLDRPAGFLRWPNIEDEVASPKRRIIAQQVDASLSLNHGDASRRKT